MLDKKTAFGADRHYHRIFDILRFHQSKHFSAKVLAPVGPAQAAAGDLSPTKMNTLESWRKHPYFTIGRGQRKIWHCVGIQLEADVLLVSAVLILLEEIGAKGGADNPVKSKQDAVLIQAGYRLQRPLESPLDRFHLRATLFQAGLDQLIDKFR